MMVNLCPEGSEGASYAFFTTVSNSALILAPVISTLMLGIWDVSKSTLEAGDLRGLTKLTVVTTVLQMCPILFIGWLPHSREELYALSRRRYSGSPVGGGILLFVVFSTIAYNFTVSALNILVPDWAGGS